MIEEIRLRNFKSHADTRIKLGRLTVLVGPNAAGKSSALEAVDLADRQLIFRLDPTLTPEPRDVLRRGEVNVSVGLRCRGFWGEVSGHPPNTWRTSVVPSVEAPEESQVPDPEVLSNWIGRVRSISLNARELAKPSPLSASRSLGAAGEGLANIIAGLKLAESPILGELAKEARRMVPNLRGVRVHTVDWGSEGSRLELLVDFQNAQGIPASAVSEGTLLTLGLLTLLLTDCPNVLLLDDIDRGLHPKAQWELVEILRNVLERHPELQILTTSHSPYLLDSLEADEVWVTALDSDGTSHCRRLADHPRAAELLDVLTTGEFLSSQGEDWVLTADA